MSRLVVLDVAAAAVEVKALAAFGTLDSGAGAAWVSWTGPAWVSWTGAAWVSWTGAAWVSWTGAAWVPWTRK